MNQIARIQLIYGLLVNNPHNSQELLSALSQKKCIISLRQLQRDLKAIFVLFKPNEKLETFRNYLNIKTFRIIEIEHQEQVKIVKPRQKKNFLDTQFGESKVISKDNNIIEQWNKFITKKTIVVISNMQFDSTGDNHRFTQHKIHFVPLKLLFHRGSYFVAGYNVNKRIIQIFELEQIKKFELSGFEEHDITLPVLLTQELNKRFGVSKNIDENTYNITLEFSSLTGSFIMRNFWHNSQTFKEKNGKIIMQLQCGINRELIGWLYLWMYNVRVVDPPILKDYYTKTLKKITQVNNETQPLVYQNLFNK